MMTNDDLMRLTQPFVPPPTIEGLSEDGATLVAKMIARRGTRPITPAPLTLNVRKATKRERKVLRQTLRQKMAENHEFWAAHRGMCKQMAHKLIREATK